jgi:hypothetical protein
MWWRAQFLLFIVLTGSSGSGCGKSVTADAPGDEPGEVVGFVEGAPSDAAPDGTWCLSRAGSELRATPVLPEGKSVRSRVLKLGDEFWTSFIASGEYLAARLDGCELGEALPTPGAAPRWSNAAPVYLTVEEQTLSVAAPGASPVVVADSVIATGWSPHAALAFFRRNAAAPISDGELHVLDLGPDLDLTAKPLYVADEVLDARWSPNDEWLVFTTRRANGVGLQAWSRSRHAIRELREYPDRASLEFESSPDGRHVLVDLPPATGAAGGELEYRLVSLDDGSEHLLREHAITESARWLWPQPWLQVTSRDGSASLFAASSAGSVDPTALEAAIGALSPRAGVATQTGDPQRIVSGLPGAAALERELEEHDAGWFSPSGQYFAGIEFNVDESGRLKEHGGLIHVSEATAAGESWDLGSLDGRSLSLDGIRWLDDSSFALAVSSNRGVDLLLFERNEDGWSRSELELGGNATGGRLFVVASDPCEVTPIRRSVIAVPGCAAPWR